MSDTELVAARAHLVRLNAVLDAAFEARAIAQQVYVRARDARDAGLRVMLAAQMKMVTPMPVDHDLLRTEREAAPEPPAEYEYLEERLAHLKEWSRLRIEACRAIEAQYRSPESILEAYTERRTLLAVLAILDGKAAVGP